MIEDFNKTSEVFKALSNPARIEILLLLARNKELMVQDIVKELDLAQSTISVHLSVLKNTNLIKSERQGTKTIFTIKQKNLEKADKSIKKLFRQFVH